MSSVFISYARGDLEAAREVYHALRRRGLDAWLDVEDLAPGARWKSSIKNQIEKSEYFVALLSSESVDSRGYVHSELRQAMDILERLPEDRIFLIPIRLDNCEPSHRMLTELNWLDFFPVRDVGIEKLVNFLNMKMRNSNEPMGDRQAEKLLGDSQSEKVEACPEITRERIDTVAGKLWRSLPHGSNVLIQGVGDTHYSEIVASLIGEIEVKSIRRGYIFHVTEIQTAICSDESLRSFVGSGLSLMVPAPQRRSFFKRRQKRKIAPSWRGIKELYRSPEATAAGYQDEKFREVIILRTGDLGRNEGSNLISIRAYLNAPGEVATIPKERVSAIAITRDSKLLPDFSFGSEWHNIFMAMSV